jgi:hypothetical protein
LSIVIPTRRTPDGELEPVTYYDAREVAARLGYAPKTIRVHTTGVKGDWPHIKLVRSPYLSDEHIARVVELLTHDPDRISEGDRPARLGIGCTTNDLEDIDQSPLPLGLDDEAVGQ